METLLPLAAEIADVLKARKQTISIAESSTGGLISASLLAVPGASAYYLGGAVVYTRQARSALTTITDDDMRKVRSASEPYAALLAKQAREQLGATWGLSETGATGPTGNRYGDAAGHSCMAISGPIDAVITLETGSADREANMRAFAERALTLLKETLAKQR
ncbi:MAG: damage-inducible protein [Alphaproteobacteria bacterium 64-6]|nr:CinA family protein [Hyphomicrobium sp.]OJU21336.1 MAG: damage-inducible protein [Alphaproteobacteria bacterium 64-6]